MKKEALLKWIKESEKNTRKFKQIKLNHEEKDMYWIGWANGQLSCLEEIKGRLK